MNPREDSDELYRPPLEPRKRWCSLCRKWCDHTARTHEPAIEAQGETG